MRSDQVAGSLFHRGGIESFMHMPDICAVKCGAFRAIANAVLVQFSTGAVAGVKLIGRYRSGSDGDVVGQCGIQAAGPLTRRPVARYAKAHHLTERMNAGVGAASADYRNPLLRELKHGRFDGFLDGWLIRLALPSRVAGAVVFDDQPDGRHRMIRARAERSIIGPIV